MPYTIRKRKCKQSDGDSGTYVLSYTDKKGKKHNNCHTSKKKAQGQIAAIEGPREMDEEDSNIAEIRALIRELLIEQAKPSPGTKEARQYVVAALQAADPSLIPQSNQPALKSSSIRIQGTEDAIRSAVESSNLLRFVNELPPGARGSSGQRFSEKYNTFEISGVGGGPATYYVVAVVAKKKDDPNLLSGQMLGIMAEYAAIEGINGGGSQLQAALADKLVKSKYDALDTAGQEMANRVYEAMVNAASSASGQLPSGNAVAGNATSSDDDGSTTAAVDVMIESGGVTVADVHIKFNDDDRIIGLQMEPHEKVVMRAKQLEQPVPEATWPFAAKYRHLREKFIADVLLPEYDIKPVPGKATVQAAKAGQELNMFQDSALRRKWLDYADGKTVTNKAGTAVSAPSGHEPLKKMIRDRVARFLSEKNLDKSIYFFNFKSSPSKPRSTRDLKVSLDVKEITGLADEITVEEVPGDLTTFPYVVMYGGQPVFRVETRTRGKENHPPQLKGKIPADVVARLKAAGITGNSEISSAGQDAVEDVAADAAEELPGGAEASFDVDEAKVESILKGMTTAIGTFEGGDVPATKTIDENLVRTVVREALLFEELTRRDKDEIKKIARKEAEKIASKKEIEKVFKKQFDSELRKALGVSFIGEKGKINKYVTDTISSEIKSMFDDKVTQNQIADLTKAVIKKLYRELSFRSTQIVDRIKL